MMFYLFAEFMIYSLTLVFMDVVAFSGEVERWRLKKFKGVKALDQGVPAR